MHNFCNNFTDYGVFIARKHCSVSNVFQWHKNYREHKCVISRDMFCVQCISMAKIVLFCFVAVLCVFSVFRETAQNSRVKIVNFSFFISKDIQMFNFNNINVCKQ